MVKKCFIVLALGELNMHLNSNLFLFFLVDVKTKFFCLKNKIFLFGKNKKNIVLIAGFVRGSQKSKENFKKFQSN